MVDFHHHCPYRCKIQNDSDFHELIKLPDCSTYPNVINFEAVHGLEQINSREPTVDQVTYDVVPFIRMVAGPWIIQEPCAMLREGQL